MRYYKILKMGQNPRFVSNILSALNGNNGELSSIMTYTFQSLILPDSEKYSALKDALIEIAEDEMHHFKSLNEILVDMGIIPYVVNDMNRPWNSTYINYELNIMKFLQANIKGEAYAIRVYENLIKMTDNQDYIERIRSIIEDETEHKEIFEKFLRQFTECNKQEINDNRE